MMNMKHVAKYDRMQVKRGLQEMTECKNARESVLKSVTVCKQEEFADYRM